MPGANRLLTYCGVISSPGIDLPKFPVATHPKHDYKTSSKTIRATRGYWTKHPETGKRLTIAELASIQTFPPEHIFYGADKDQVRQIGNAVSPLVGQAILEEVKRSLMRTDGIYSDGRSTLLKPYFSE